MSRNVAMIDSEIAAIKAGNKNWATNSAAIKQLTVLVTEKVGEFNNRRTDDSTFCRRLI
jgi:hypothetical protein